MAEDLKLQLYLLLSGAFTDCIIVAGGVKPITSIRIRLDRSLLVYSRYGLSGHVCVGVRHGGAAVHSLLAYLLHLSITLTVRLLLQAQQFAVCGGACTCKTYAPLQPRSRDEVTKRHIHLVSVAQLKHGLDSLVLAAVKWRAKASSTDE